MVGELHKSYKKYDFMLSSLILAGGSNRRYPILKPFIEIEGETILERQLKVLSPISDEVLLSTNLPEVYFKFGLKMVGDIGMSRGPLSGILSGLLNSKSSKMLVVACDMPFIRTEVIELILSKEKEAPLIVCSFRGKVHPLIGLYDRALAVKIEDFLKAGNQRVNHFINTVDRCIIEESEIKDIDPEGCSFVNINRPEELNKIIGGKICLD